MRGTYWLGRIRLFIGLLVLALLNVVALYWFQPIQRGRSETTAKCEALFGLVDTLPNLPHFLRPVVLNASETPALWTTRTLEIMDPYRLLFTQQDVVVATAQAQENWPNFIKGHDCAWFGEWFRPVWKESRQRLRHALAQQNAALAKVKVGKLKDLNLDRPKTFALSEKERHARIVKAATQVLESADAKVLKAFKGDRQKYVEFSVEELAVPSFIEPEVLLTKAYLSAKDPFSTFFSPAEFSDFSQELSGETTGIGIQAVRTPDGLWVQKVLPKTPASKLLKAEDTITHIDGVSLNYLTGTLSRRLLSGREGSQLQLRFCRPNGKCQTSALIRQKFTPDEAKIEYQLHQDTKHKGQIAVIEIPTFYGRSPESPSERSSAEDLEAVIRELIQKEKQREIHLSAIILDLRGNPGGYLEESIQMASLFLGDKPVVGLREPERNRVHWGQKKEVLYRGPLVVLVDRLSASAAEVLAGSLKDHKRAVLIGSDRTYGKGTVQRLIPLNEVNMAGAAAEVYQGAAIKLTTSVFYSPHGHTPASKGVKTDIILSSANNEGGVETEFNNPPHFSDTKPFTKDGEDYRASVEEAPSILDTQMTELRALSKPKPGLSAKELLLTDKKTRDEKQVDEAVVIAQELSRILNVNPLTGSVPKTSQLPMRGMKQL